MKMSPAPAVRTHSSHTLAPHSRDYNPILSAGAPVRAFPEEKSMFH